MKDCEKLFDTMEVVWLHAAEDHFMDSQKKIICEWGVCHLVERLPYRRKTGCDSFDKIMGYFVLHFLFPMTQSPTAVTKRQ